MSTYFLYISLSSCLGGYGQADKTSVKYNCLGPRADKTRWEKNKGDRELTKQEVGPPLPALPTSVFVQLVAPFIFSAGGTSQFYLQLAPSVF